MPDLKTAALYVLTVLVVVMGLATWGYRTQLKATSFALATQSTAIVQQNLAAAALLKTRTAERDAKQAELNKRAEAQEKTDGKAVAQIGADDKLQRAAPVRVRVQNCTSDAGGGGGSAAGGAAATTEAGAADPSSASGVLSKAAAGRLADALNEVETMSAAYASCRARLLP
ncbi:membrane protein implicated in regulation of membrane protease activity [Variovorax boronicumulans]|uniref:Membrane protein implicated in regulation of membrane protease activity n=1 Tax=Variovorax boronicumulans TaxID=436515 RepID=A0AAW8D560_9BURK|nr:hypothetical protein [Variovorax boronicumulans]MDP9895369.1 membrane protein implicated in regulation of membrane protease activity [Variovorax boronicumulans]MDQ0055409.1 membrane protein implicated in regulation of membrane protease activity [Variovorax boronicumulans]